MHRFRATLLLAFLTLCPSLALAYSSESEVSDPCHERITQVALRSARVAAPLLGPAYTSDNERTLASDAPFELADDMRDLGAVTLILGNRDVDLHGNQPSDVEHLAEIHGNPDNQPSHCLRRPDHDEPAGSEQALSECRATLRSHVERALTGLNPDGSVNLNARQDVDVALDLRGVASASLPIYYVEMGRALHGLQDGFSHTWRTPDQLRVTVVLNYAEQVEDELDEGRDGPPHSSMLDECVDLDELRSQRLGLASLASSELLVASLAGASDAERLAATQTVIDRYLSYQPGCTKANNWCDAAENAYRDSEGCGCTHAGSEHNASAAWPLLLPALMLLWRRRRASLCGNRAPRLASLAFAAALLATSATGSAQGQAEQAEPTTQPEQDPGVTPTASQNVAIDDRTDAAVDLSPDSPDRPEPFPLGVYAAAGGSLSNAAAALSLGARYRLSSRFLIGLDAEYNPWFSRIKKEFRPGVANFYATLIHRVPLSFETINLRSSLHLGVSRILFPLYGVPEGTMGPYVGFSLLGLDWELARSLYLVVDPADIAIPIPQTDGVPFSYPQYRITVGLQLGA